MGLYDTVIIAESVPLPGFEGDNRDIGWQTKNIGRPFMETYKITEDGRLKKKEASHRDKTEEELQDDAEEHGFESWEAWEAADTLGPLPTWEQTVDEEWWEDVEQHGSFEFHQSNVEDDAKWWYSYEARFTDGELDEIILLRRELMSVEVHT